jgi:hypothetical protein
MYSLQYILYSMYILYSIVCTCTAYSICTSLIYLRHSPDTLLGYSYVLQIIPELDEVVVSLLEYTLGAHKNYLNLERWPPLIPLDKYTNRAKLTADFGPTEHFDMAALAVCDTTNNTLKRLAPLLRVCAGDTSATLLTRYCATQEL